MPRSNAVHHSIDSLAGAVSGLQVDVARQTEKLDQISARQMADFRELLTTLHENYKELVGLQQDTYEKFDNRLDKLLSRQDEHAAVMSGLAGAVGHQAEKLDQISARQTADFKELLAKVHDNYKELVNLQRESFDKLLSRQDEQARAIRGDVKETFDKLLSRQDEQAQAIRSDMKETFDKLLSRQDEQARAIRSDMKEALNGFADRLDRMLSKQDEQAVALRGEMKADFARVIDRQDSHFRWLFGLLLASAITIGLALIKMH